MNAGPAKNARKPTLGPQEAALRDALVVASLIFLSFLGSALLVLWNVEAREKDRIRAKLEAVAWKAAAVVHSTSVRAHDSSEEPPDPDRARETALRLKSLAAVNPLLEEVYYLYGNGAGDFNAEGLPFGRGFVERELADQARRSMDSFSAQFVPTPEWNLVCTVPIVAHDGQPVGAIVARSKAFRQTGEIAGARIGFAAAAAAGTTLAAIVGIAVYRSSSKFHRTFRKLEETEQRLRDVSNASGEFIWEVDPAWRYTFLSARVKDVLGFSPEEMLGRTPLDFVPDADLAEVKGHFDHISVKGALFRDFEFRAGRKDGSLIWLTTNGLPVDGGAPGAFRGTARDITVRKESQRELLREKEAAQAATIAKSQFLAMMSHEIRTPLNSVLGFAELLERTRLDTAQREHLGMIRRSGDALLALLNDVLQFSRHEFSNVSLENEPTEMRPFLREILDLHRPAAEAKGVVLDLAVEDGVPEYLEVDRGRLRQVLLNLVGNAVKFTERGSVSVRAESGPRPESPNVFSLCLTVRDSGAGIGAGTVPLLFKPFSQGDTSTTRKFGGTGLGLAICKRLAKLFGGTIRLVETSPQGSTFQFCAPFRIAAASKVEPAALATKSTTVRLGKTARILVAEDNSASRKLMAMMLAPLAASIDIAENWLAALSKHAENPFSVILMDLQMPEMDGLEATKKIREAEARAGDGSKVIIIALTANALSGDRERCIDAGMDDYLTKPVKKADLYAVIGRFLAPEKSAPPVSQ